MIALLLAQTASSDDSSSLFGLDAETIAFAFSLFGAVFVVVQVHLAFRNRRIAEVDAERDWVARWKEHADGWALATMLIRGPDNYYVKGAADLRALFAAIERQQQIADDLWHRSHHGEPALLENWHVAQDALRAASRAVEEPIREMIEFLDGMGRQVARGWVTPAVARSAVGAELLRSGAVVRGLVGPAYGSPFELPEPMPSSEMPPSGWTAEQIAYMEQAAALESAFQPQADWLDYYPAIRLRLLMLVDVVWAEAARRGELAAIDSHIAALVKADTGSGVRNRRRLHRLCLVERRRPFSWWHSLKLQWLLTWAEHPRDSIAEENLVLVQAVGEHAQPGTSLVGAARRLRRLLASSGDQQPWILGWHHKSTSE